MIEKRGDKYVAKMKDGREVECGSEEEARKRLHAEGGHHDGATVLSGVARFDLGGLDRPARTPAGFLRADAHLSRAGIFLYRQPDGTVRRELRPEDEVFHADSLNSFALAPVTDDHPPGNLTAENAREYQRGAVGENVRRDGDHVRASVLVTDSDLISKMEKGKSQVSCGYNCDVELTPGEWRGQRYDAVQRRIRGNHLAVVDRGRAGSARVRMDAHDAAMVSDPPGGEPASTPERTVTVKTFRHDGITYEGSEQVMELVAKLARERQDAVDSLSTVKADAQKLVDAANAKADQAKSELDKAKADAAKLPDQIRGELKARASLEVGARKILGKTAKLDGLSDREVRAQVLKKLEPKLDVAGKSDEYVAARFDAAIDGASDSSEEAITEVRRDTERAEDTREDGEEERLDVAASAAKNAKAMRELWKQPIGRGRDGKAA